VVEVETADGKVVVNAPHIVIATGSRPIQIPGFSYADERIMDSTKALDLDHVPEDLVVIGGGYIGLELGTICPRSAATSRSSRCRTTSCPASTWTVCGSSSVA
jgi:pyruvate/2-oxoglutarate dehydrogenase complex dihydrolipoamide dehydrogenase (E3) component